MSELKRPKKSLEQGFAGLHINALTRRRRLFPKGKSTQR